VEKWREMGSSLETGKFPDGASSSHVRTELWCGSVMTVREKCDETKLRGGGIPACARSAAATSRKSARSGALGKSYHLLGLISFFTAGEDECRAWTIPLNTRAQNGAGAIHSDLEKHFIRAETIRWDQLLEAGSEANARAKGTLRLEGKDYIVQDGDVMHIRHSG
jgi:ribosome-binding ATPase YchF (GTP1/OBG family)